MENNQIKDAIKQLPIQQRAVAIALKNIYDQIKSLTRQEQQEIDQNHLSFISRFKALQKTASQIIKGKQIKQEQLDTSDKFFSEAQNPQKQKIMKSGNKLQNYWLNCMQNSQYGPNLNQQQKSILRHVTDLQTNITTNQIQLIVTIQKNQIVQYGTFHRRLVLDNGMPISFQGEQPKFIVAKQQGVFNSYILKNTQQVDQMNIVFATLGNLVNEVIPYSLEYYLGALENGQFDEGQEDGEQEEEGEEQV